MAMNSPSGPMEATRNASMVSAVMQARDKEKIHGSLDERERDRLAQEQLALEKQERTRNQRGLFRRIMDRLPFG